jgi:N-acetylglucosaminyldiphosphoundecaprenol N-acetyl-beta-D-mannosaminyltransferase
MDFSKIERPTRTDADSGYSPGSSTNGIKMPAAPPRTRRRILNAHVDVFRMPELMRDLDRGMVFTLNPDHLYHLQRNRAFYDAYQAAEFVTVDSKYVFWGLRWLGRAIPEKCSGSDIVPTFCAHHAANDQIKVFFLGSRPGTSERAMEVTNERAGRRQAVGAMSPSMNFVNDAAEIEEAIRRVNDSGANVLVVGIGSPKQEIWMHAHRHRMPGIRIMMGVGATIDYVAGTVKRAPGWMTRNGLEWVYRMTTSPRRYWRRYLRTTEYFWLLATDSVGLYRDPMRKAVAP